MEYSQVSIVGPDMAISTVFSSSADATDFSLFDFFRRPLAEILTCQGTFRDLGVAVVANEKVLLVEEARILLVDSKRSDKQVLVGDDSQRSCRRFR